MKSLLIACLAVLIFSGNGFAKLAIVTLDEAIRDNDLIVVGTLKDISERFEEDGTYGKGKIVVEKFIAGNVKTGNGELLKSGDKLHLKYAETFSCVMGSHKRIENEKGVFILTLDDAGEIKYQDFRPLEALPEIKKLLGNGIKLNRTKSTIKLYDENFSISQSNIEDTSGSQTVYCELVTDKSKETDYSNLYTLLVILASIRLYRFLYRSRFKIR